MGWVHCTFQQISDILMKRIISPSLKPLAPFAPGGEPSERASCLWGPATEWNSRPGGLGTRGLSLNAM